MSQTELFSESASGSLTWQQVQGVTNNFHYALLEHGEPTRYWVRYRIKPSATPYFIVTPWGVYPGEFASAKEAQEKVLWIRRGGHRSM